MSLVQKECDFVYYILEGKGTFYINDRPEPCAHDNLVVIPKGTKFSYEGSSLRMLLSSTPPWHADQELAFDND